MFYFRRAGYLFDLDLCKSVGPELGFRWSLEGETIALVVQQPGINEAIWTISAELKPHSELGQRVVPCFVQSDRASGGENAL